MADVRRSLSDLAPREAVIALTDSLRDLAPRLSGLAQEERDEPLLLAPLDTITQALREVLSGLRSEGR